MTAIRIRTLAGAAATAAAALALLAGCAGTPVREQAAEPAPGERVVDIAAGSYFFEPKQVTVPAGEPVVLRIRDEATVIPHAFVLSDAGGKVVARSELRAGGTTLVRVPPLAAGAYPFYCDKSLLGSTHRGKGMEGTLRAVAPGGRDPVTGAPPGR